MLNLQNMATKCKSERRYAFKGGGMKFRKTFWFVRRYVYLGRYVFQKLLRMGGGTFIWVGTFIWQLALNINQSEKQIDQGLLMKSSLLAKPPGNRRLFLISSVLTCANLSA